MIKQKTTPVYYQLVIESGSKSTEIWLGDKEGHFVQKDIGLLRSSWLPGDYTVEFGLGLSTYPISLRQASRYTEAKITAGPSCPRPIPNPLQKEE